MQFRIVLPHACKHAGIFSMFRTFVSSRRNKSMARPKIATRKLPPIAPMHQSLTLFIFILFIFIFLVAKQKGLCKQPPFAKARDVENLVGYPTPPRGGVLVVSTCLTSRRTKLGVLDAELSVAATLTEFESGSFSLVSESWNHPVLFSACNLHAAT